MANDKSLPLTTADYKACLATLRQALVDVAFLSEFEHDFVRDAVKSFRKAGIRVRYTAAQMLVFHQIGVKLCVLERTPDDTETDA